MCIYGIFKTDFKVHSFQGRKNTKPQEGLSNSEYVNTYKPIANVFSGMILFYKCFIKNFAFIMALITKLMRKTKLFIWTIKC
jgi:hypothetical protein